MLHMLQVRSFNLYSQNDLFQHGEVRFPTKTEPKQTFMLWKIVTTVVSLLMGDATWLSVRTKMLTFIDQNSLVSLTYYFIISVAAMLRHQRSYHTQYPKGLRSILTRWLCKDVDYEECVAHK